MFTASPSLWINLVTDTFPAIALGVEPVEPGVMNHKPRGRKASFFLRWCFEFYHLSRCTQAAIVMSVYGLAIAYPVHVGDNHAIHADALTMAFVTLGLIQLFHAYNVKSVYQSILTVGPFQVQDLQLVHLGILHPSYGNNRRRAAWRNLPRNQTRLVTMGIVMLEASQWLSSSKSLNLSNANLDFDKNAI